jgi:hypothetical protein
MLQLLLLAAAVGIEQPPKITAATPVLVATQTCHDLFDAAIAQRMADREPGEIRNLVVAGQSYRVAPGRTKGQVWAFPLNPALGVIRASEACFR